MIVEDFEHHTGTHCGSVAMTDLLGHAGLELSEAMVFGLGNGLGFYYLTGDSLSPSRQIVGRSASLETSAAEAVGAELVETVPADADEAWDDLVDALDDGAPVMVAGDLSELPYWETDTTFNGHRVVVAGREPSTDEVLVADTHFEGLQRISRDALRRCRASTAPPAMHEPFTYWRLRPGSPPALEEAIRRALRRNVDIMEDPHTDAGGLEGLETFGDEVDEWVDCDDAEWCYRYAYQCIEKRGTGGGMFRQLYRSFLEEAAEEVPVLAERRLPLSMSRTAEAWSTLATYLDGMATYIETDGEEPDDHPMHHVESMAHAVFQFENMFWDQLDGIVR